MDSVEIQCIKEKKHQKQLCTTTLKNTESSKFEAEMSSLFSYKQI